jgi:cation transport ATPase
MYELGAVEHGTSRPGRWLRANRIRIALWIAVVEAVLAAFLHDVSRWTIVALAAIFVPIYLLWGREWHSDALRQVSWIAAASQALAVVAVIFAFIVGVFVLILAGIFAAIALVMILSDRR